MYFVSRHSGVRAALLYITHAQDKPGVNSSMKIYWAYC
jgi:hypothetical protein